MRAELRLSELLRQNRPDSRASSLRNAGLSPDGYRMTQSRATPSSALSTYRSWSEVGQGMPA